MAGTLFVVATPIGNLEDITARALRVLREATLIAAEDTRRTANLLRHYGITTKTTSLHEHNEHGKTPALVSRLVAGDNIALVSDAGTPTVSDPGLQLIRASVEQGIRVEPIPGPNAAIAALSVSGLGGDGFAFIGFPPIKAKDRTDWFDRLRTSGRTVIFYEAPHKIRRTLEEMQRRIGDVPVVIARELTKSHEELVRGPIPEVLKRLESPRGEFTIIVDIGYMTNMPTLNPSSEVTDESVAAEFGELTAGRARSRREAIGLLSRKHGISAREIFARLERAKISGG